MSLGMWIWQISKCDGGQISKIVARCKRIGLGHVLIKTNDGRGEFNGVLGPTVKALKVAGINVWSWTYTYGRFPEQEAEAFATRSLALSVNGLCIDAEVEYKGRSKEAGRFMKELRKLVGKKPVALSTYYRPKLHSSFPWKEFLEQSDYAMPQVYWWSNDPVKCVRKAYDEYDDYIGRVKIIPTGASYPEATGNPENIALFINEAKRLGTKQMNFWSWQHATTKMWGVLEQHGSSV